mgnify:CR=1 FL=1
MFDKHSVFLEADNNGLFTVVAREYRINSYVYTVMIDSQKLSVEMRLQSDLRIGDKCNVKSISGKEFLILPEKIRSY